MLPRGRRRGEGGRGAIGGVTGWSSRAPRRSESGGASREQMRARTRAVDARLRPRRGCPARDRVVVGEGSGGVARCRSDEYSTAPPELHGQLAPSPFSHRHTPSTERRRECQPGAWASQAPENELHQHSVLARPGAYGWPSEARPQHTSLSWLQGTKLEVSHLTKYTLCPSGSLWG